MSIAHNQTNKILETSNRNSKSIYLKAFKSAKNEFMNIYSKIRLDVEMTAQEKIEEANKYGRIQHLTDYLVGVLLDTNKEALKKINNNLKSIYQLNYNSLVEQFKKDGVSIDKINKSEANEDVKENVNPYNEIAINTATDKANLKRNISNSLISSILKASSVSMAYKGIKEVFEKNLASSIRIAETQTTRSENDGLFQAMKEGSIKAKEKGLVLVKVWHTQEDEKVRNAHARAEGQEAEIDKPFYVGGEQLMYPGDIMGSPGNIINCRCFMTYKLINK